MKNLVAWAIIIAFLALICWAATLKPAHSASPSNADPEFSAWFHDLRNPTTGGICCDQADGHILGDGEWRAKGDSFEAIVEGAWRDVPKEVVLNRVDNPTGGAVIFYPSGGYTIFCFVRPSET